MELSFKCLLLMFMFIFVKSDYKLSNDFTIPETAQQISFIVKANTYFSIRLKGNPTTGYTWIMLNGKSYSGSEGIIPMNLSENYNSTLYNQERHTIGNVGFGGTFQFIFQATEASNKIYPLIFSYRRPWEDGAALKVVTVNIKITK